MSEAAEPKSDFRFVLNSVRSECVQTVAFELTNLFPLDLPNALAIVKNSPIILLDKLTPQQARSVGTYAIRLKALGADVQVTGQPVGKLQVLRWPLLPEIARRPGNHLICPNCGARLQVHVHVSPGERAAAAPAGEPAAPSAPQPQPQPQAAAPPPQPAPAPLVPPQPEPEEVVLEPVADEEPAPIFDEEVVLEEPVAGAERRSVAPPATPGQPVGGGGACRVMLVGKIRGEKKRNAADLIAYYLGLTPEEAMAQLNKTVVTVAKDLTPEQAEECKTRFAEIDVKVTVKG